MTTLRAWKQRLGYYKGRRALLRSPFLRALRPTDAFLVGHPKSGNTWLAYMIAILGAGEASETVTLRNVGEFVPVVHGRDDRIRRYESLANPRVFRNENPQYPDLYPRTVYLVRDPRAVLVSFWHMYQVIFGDRSLPLDQFVDQYMSKGGVFRKWNAKLRRWDDQVADYLGRERAGDPILVVRYEEMIEDRHRCLETVAAFLGFPSGGETVGRAAELGSFTSMRHAEDRFGAEAYQGKAKGEGKFVRTGRVDGWRDEMSPEVATRIVDEFGSVMRLAGYP